MFAIMANGERDSWVRFGEACAIFVYLFLEIVVSWYECTTRRLKWVVTQFIGHGGIQLQSPKI